MKKFGTILGLSLTVFSGLALASDAPTRILVLPLRWHLEFQEASYSVDRSDGTAQAYVVTFDRDLNDSICGAFPRACSGTTTQPGLFTQKIAVPGLGFDAATNEVVYTEAQKRTVCASVRHARQHDIFIPTGRCAYQPVRDEGVYLLIQE